MIAVLLEYRGPTAASRDWSSPRIPLQLWAAKRTLSILLPMIDFAAIDWLECLWGTGRHLAWRTRILPGTIVNMRDYHRQKSWWSRLALGNARRRRARPSCWLVSFESGGVFVVASLVSLQLALARRRHWAGPFPTCTNLITEQKCTVTSEDNLKPGTAAWPRPRDNAPSTLPASSFEVQKASTIVSAQGPAPLPPVSLDPSPWFPLSGCSLRSDGESFTVYSRLHRMLTLNCERARLLGLARWNASLVLRGASLAASWSAVSVRVRHRHRIGSSPVLAPSHCATLLCAPHISLVTAAWAAGSIDRGGTSRCRSKPHVR
jgi:hypothetical protein